MNWTATGKIAMAVDPLKPGVGLLCKLGSIAVHAKELSGPGRHAFDAAALQTVLGDREVVEWLTAMGALALVPKER